MYKIDRLGRIWHQYIEIHCWKKKIRVLLNNKMTAEFYDCEAFGLKSKGPEGKFEVRLTVSITKIYIYNSTKNATSFQVCFFMTEIFLFSCIDFNRSLSLSVSRSNAASPATTTSSSPSSTAASATRTCTWGTTTSGLTCRPSHSYLGTNWQESSPR